MDRHQTRTDGALVLGMAHVIMEKGLYDTAFADDWTHGLGEFKEYVKGFTPEKVEKIHGSRQTRSKD